MSEASRMYKFMTCLTTPQPRYKHNVIECGKCENVFYCAN